MLSKMTKKEVYQLLQDYQNDRGMQHWAKNPFLDWTSFGIGLTQLKKIAKQIGKNHELALELWPEKNFDIKNISLLIEEPKKVDQSQIEAMVDDVSMWMLSHVFVQVLFSKVPFAKNLAEDWRQCHDDVKRRIGYSFLYYYVKDKKVLDTYFIPILNVIANNLQSEENLVKDAMNNALLAIGSRSKDLHRLTLPIAKSLGPVKVDYGDNSCQAVDVVKHLTSDRILKKLG